MHSVQLPGASAPPLLPSVLRVDRVRRRISASDSVANLIALLAFGEPADRPQPGADLVIGSAGHGR